MSRSPRPTRKEIQAAADQGRILPQDRPHNEVRTVGELLDGVYNPQGEFLVGKDKRGHNVWAESAGEAVIDYEPKMVIDGWMFYHTIMHDDEGNRSSYLAISHQKNQRKGDVTVLPCKTQVFTALAEKEDIVNPITGKKVTKHREWLHEFIVMTLFKNGFDWDVDNNWSLVKGKYMSLFNALQKLPETLVSLHPTKIGKASIVSYDPIRVALSVGAADKN